MTELVQCERKMIAGLVSVIIVNWNGKHFLPACLTTLFAQTYGQFEVIFVDNASVDGSVAYVREAFPTVIIVENTENYGFAVGNQLGLAHCQGEYIFLLNNDTEVHPDVLGNLVAAIKPQQIAGACGKIYSLTDKGKCVFTLPKIDSHTGMAIWINEDSSLRAVDYLSGNSMILKKSIIDHVGFLDETYFAYFEETDLCARIIRAGYDLMYVPDVHVWHKEMGSTPSWFNQYYMARNQFRFILKNFDIRYIPYALQWNGLRNIRNAWRSLRNKQYKGAWLIVKALLWNVVFLPHTLYCRQRDLNKIGSLLRSYNENLPLREFK
jgi:hypothetical protein